MTEGKRVYRGVELPDGMTPECLDALASLFADFADDLLKLHGEDATPAQAAVMAFEAATRGRPKIEITQGMIEAGAGVILDECQGTGWSSEEVAKAVFLAMARAST